MFLDALNMNQISVFRSEASELNINHNHENVNFLKIVFFRLKLFLGIFEVANKKEKYTTSTYFYDTNKRSCF